MSISDANRKCMLLLTKENDQNPERADRVIAYRTQKMKAYNTQR